MTTLISHIFNEEFLLPFFIEHHLSKFDHGIILDFGSTDASKSIIEKMAPNWKIIDCSEKSFNAVELDNLVSEIEKNTIGVCLTLTATEFLIGDPRIVSKEAIIPTVSLLRLPNEPEISMGQKFHEVYKNGIFPFSLESNSETEWMERKKGRRIGTLHSPYPVGRHFDLLGDSLLLIYRVSNCLANEEMIKRRLQIQNKIPESDKALGYGIQHTNYGGSLTREILFKTIETEIKFCTNLSAYLQFFLEIENITLGKDMNSTEFNLVSKIFSKFEFNQNLLMESQKKNFLVHDLQTTLGSQASIICDLQTTLGSQASIICDLQTALGSQASIISDLDSKLTFLKISQSRPSQNLRKFFQNLPLAFKVRFNKITQKLTQNSAED